MNYKPHVQLQAGYKIATSSTIFWNGCIDRILVGLVWFVCKLAMEANEHAELKHILWGLRDPVDMEV